MKDKKPFKTPFNGVLVPISYFKKHFKPCCCFLFLKTFCSTLNSWIGDFVFWYHEQVTYWFLGNSNTHVLTIFFSTSPLFRVLTRKLRKIELLDILIVLNEEFVRFLKKIGELLIVILVQLYRKLSCSCVVFTFLWLQAVRSPRYIQYR